VRGSFQTCCAPSVFATMINQNAENRRSLIGVTQNAEIRRSFMEENYLLVERAGKELRHQSQR
jgi:hypothetical protein